MLRNLRSVAFHHWICAAGSPVGGSGLHIHCESGQVWVSLDGHEVDGQTFFLYRGLFDEPHERKRNWLIVNLPRLYCHMVSEVQ